MGCSAWPCEWGSPGENSKTATVVVARLTRAFRIFESITAAILPETDAAQQHEGQFMHNAVAMFYAAIRRELALAGSIHRPPPRMSELAARQGM